MDRSEVGIVALVLGAAALVLAAPVLGRMGLDTAANVTMALAALCGVASFAVVGAQTFRSSRERKGEP